MDQSTNDPTGPAGTPFHDETQDAAAQAAPGAEPALEERLRAAEAEAADYKDRALRAMAEVENVRRRAQREKDDATKYAVTGFARDLVGSADNLRRALASVSEAQIKDDVMRNLMAGVAATERELTAVFERHGIRRIDARGQKFDHNLHQAIFEAENTGQPAGTIVEVLQDGYILHDRLLRPAMVGVAKGEAPTASDRVNTVA